MRTKFGDMKTVNGKPVSEGQIDEWVAKAEKGYDVALLKRRGVNTRGLYTLREAETDDTGDPREHNEQAN